MLRGSKWSTSGGVDQLQRSTRSFAISSRSIFSSAGFKSVLPSSCRRAQPFTMSCNFCSSNPGLPLVAPYAAARRRQLSRSLFVKCTLSGPVLAPSGLPLISLGSLYPSGVCTIGLTSMVNPFAVASSSTLPSGKVALTNCFLGSLKRSLSAARKPSSVV
jgi:hypothetical protein